MDPFLEDVKPRSSYDSAGDRDDSMLLHSPKVRDLASHHPRNKYLPLLTHILTCLLTVLMTLSLTTLTRQDKSNGQCYDRFNAPSPITSAVRHLPFSDLSFVYSLWSHSPYKGPPTPAVNRAWHDLLSLGTISASASDVALTGQSPNASSVIFPASVPAAAGRYVAVAGGAHHLHCLHYLWQDHYLSSSSSSFPEEEVYFPEQAATKAAVPEMYERHYEHCVDYLRQGIMCHYDTGIIPYNWVLDNQQPTPNGNTRHRCVNWDALKAVLEEQAVEVPEGFEWMQPEEAASLAENP